MDLPLLILDLDETLIYGTEAPLARLPDLLVGRFFIYQRPHLAEFFAQVVASTDWPSAQLRRALTLRRS